MLRDLTLSEEVLDIEWSPYCSTLFASTAKDGRLELWDLNKKPMDPIFIDWDDADNKRKRNPLKTYIPRTCLKFSQKDPVLVTGHQNGEISVYRINGYEGTDGVTVRLLR